MNSLLGIKNLNGSVKVHDRDWAEELQKVSQEDILRTTFMPRGRHRHSKKKSGRHSVATPCHTSNDDLPIDSTSLKGSNWLSSTQAKELVDQLRKESNATKSIYGPLLETEDTLVHDVDEYLGQADKLALRKKELLHKTWSQRVFEPMRCKILEVMQSPEFAGKDRRHRQMYSQYLEYTNQKGFVFLDTMDKGEYYAQALNGHRPSPITVKTSSLQDPLLLQGRERGQEEQTILRCTTGEVYSLSDIDQIKLPPLPLVPLGRHNTSCMAWLEMPLGNIGSTPRKASRLRMKGNCTQSQINFGQSPQISSGGPVDPSLVDCELKLQKKRMFVNTPPFDRPSKPVLKPPFACCSELAEGNRRMCPVSA
ncbi:hypothetical protein ACOMHN_045664 [Nucella lapillus]